MPIIEGKLERSASFAEAANRFLDRVGEWIDACMAAFAEGAPSDAPDQFSCMAAWEPYLRARPRPDVLAFLAARRDAAAAVFTATGMWRHGYWTMQDVAGGVEYFDVFLRSLARLQTDAAQTPRQVLDGALTRSQVLDAAEHFGNWSADVPPWYDARIGLFLSDYLGADGIRAQSRLCNLPEHLRGIRLCLLAHSLGGGDEYLRLSRDYAGLWADALLRREELPVGLSASGPCWTLDKELQEVYRPRRENGGHWATSLDRAENILAAGGVDVFLELWACTGEARFLAASERVLDVLTPQLSDPDAGVVAAALRAYRRAGGLRRYDTVLSSALGSLAPSEIHTIGLQPYVIRLTRLSGAGKQADMPIWFENLHLRRHSPLLLAAAAEVVEDAALAALALDIARIYFELACEALPDGRYHGGANTIGAVARGHRRDNGAGVVTAALGPLLEAFGPL